VIYILPLIRNIISEETNFVVDERCIGLEFFFKEITYSQTFLLTVIFLLTINDFAYKKPSFREDKP